MVVCVLGFCGFVSCVGLAYLGLVRRVLGRGCTCSDFQGMLLRTCILEPIEMGRVLAA